ncbi:FKBP-type peptidyl-prolyl cis-trans isomerase N-terminal domain-containing protein [Bdellovibrio svalbardensis]|uniref:Peptidyl-prolyl cis-trans isomerase n=1 Tax=Bdellovibrio svalbardensis TaxID=2972972 RepID=A0ABT6DG36_9BACT|nr:FKBP-type peptidyl-prolyl cis-trans isomerase N-terminal domain-containing protein [Bdellovibrio svalbardensis]MDG0815432.1 FKBP-type peptidyl-prolyl cis-trans isomerase [Bdellovibrio svalbardensis]
MNIFRIKPNLSICFILSIGLTGCFSKKNDLEEYSYNLGLQMGYGIREQKISLNEKAFFKGLKEGLNPNSDSPSIKEVHQTLMNYQQNQNSKNNAELVKRGLEAEDYLRKNQSAPDIKLLDDGLQYKIVSKGHGRQPKLSDTVVLKYQGRLLDESVFVDSSDKESPKEFKVVDMISAWRKVLPLMNEGQKVIIFSGPQHAFGIRGTTGVPPQSLVIYDLELVKVKP